MRTLIRFLTLGGLFMALVFPTGSALAAPPDGGNQEELQELFGAVKDLPAGIRVVRDLPYGPDPRQRFDVYAPTEAHDAPVIVMVHGGAWRFGDKNNGRVVENKVARWVSRGFVFISVNYRMLPDADPRLQAEDVARALATAQSQAASWGGNSSRFILMGHSAGAHLVALLSADPQRAYASGASPWLGSILLDSAALDVAKVMTRPHLGLYDRAFGTDRDFWKELSPVQHLNPIGPPVLAVCSTQRRDDPCAAARDFSAKLRALGRSASVLEKDLSHGEINAFLGEDLPYTEAVEAFLRTLGPGVATLLPPPSHAAR